MMAALENGSIVRTDHVKFKALAENFVNVSESLTVVGLDGCYILRCSIRNSMYGFTSLNYITKKVDEKLRILKMD